jgi:hypothetical protein
MRGYLALQSAQHLPHNLCTGLAAKTLFRNFAQIVP